MSRPRSAPPASRHQWRKGTAETDMMRIMQESGVSGREHGARSPSPAQVQPHGEHRAPRIDEDRRLLEVRAEETVGGQRFLRGVVERVEDIEQQFDASKAAGANGPRD